MCSAYGGQKRALYPLELDIQMLESHGVEAGNLNPSLVGKQPVLLTAEPRHEASVTPS